MHFVFDPNWFRPNWAKKARTFTVLLLSLGLSPTMGCSNPEASSQVKYPSLWEFTHAAADHSETSEPRFETIIRKPTGPPVIVLEQPDPQGRVGEIACSTCHSVREPNPANRVTADLDQFHQEMEFAHGQLVCLSCHNPQDYDTLRLADGSSLEYPGVMTLCAQCHGPQMTAYEHGAHGGMNGYWDLSRGPRVRNNCIDCHDPHQPKFPSMVPTFKPRDRFLEQASDHEAPSHD